MTQNLAQPLSRNEDRRSPEIPALSFGADRDERFVNFGSYRFGGELICLKPSTAE